MSWRILHILDHSLPLQSGYAFRTIALLREQRALGWETIHVTTPKHYASGPQEEDVAGLRFHRTRIHPEVLGRIPIVNNAMVVLATASRIEEIIRRAQPDIVHAHSPCLNGLAALRVSRRFGLPVVYEMRASWEDAAVDHGTTAAGSVRYRLSRRLETHVLRKADAVITICEGLAREIESRNIPAERITVVPNAVDVDDFEMITQSDLGLSERLGLGAGPVLGFIGSFYGYEGLDDLIRALPLVLRTHPGAHAVLVGGGPAEDQLRQLASDLNITERVVFTGRVPHQEVQRYYSIIDMLVYPRISIRLTELVTPLKPLEAMSLGRLFIASDVGGHREVIPHHLRPYMFKPGDPKDLGRAALQMLANRDSWPALASAGRRYVTEQRTWRSSASRYSAVYAACAPRAAAA